MVVIITYWIQVKIKPTQGIASIMHAQVYENDIIPRSTVIVGNGSKVNQSFTSLAYIGRSARRRTAFGLSTYILIILEKLQSSSSGGGGAGGSSSSTNTWLHVTTPTDNV